MKTCNDSRPALAWRAALLCLALAVPGCGGDNTSVEAGAREAPQPSVRQLPASAESAPTNVLAVTVRAGPDNNVNVPFASVTICTPGNALQCQTIDDLIVDTGSTGLRLFASALSPSLALPRLSDAATGAVLAECTQFVDGSIWGGIRVADVRMAGEAANAIPIQIVADPELPAVPEDCSSTGSISNTVREFGGNGILGVSVFLQDCGALCEQEAQNTLYYRCADGACAMTVVPLAQQVQNPVAFFAVNNNGVMLNMPDLQADSAMTAAGELVFGIGTQANNGLGAATVLSLDANGLFTTVYKGRNFTQGFIDSGSNANFFFDPDIQSCENGFYCGGAPLALTATNIGQNGSSSAVSFTVADARAALNANPTHSAFETLAGPSGNATVFDWGMPFFYGRKVFTAIEGRAFPGGVGPGFAY